MRPLTPETIDDYLRDRGIVGARASALAGGVSASVFRVETSEGRFVLKQSCPQLRTRDAWFSDVNRIFREVAVMRALGEFLPPETIPRVLWVDEANFAFAMSHAPGGQKTWKDALLAGEVDQSLADVAGCLLGTIHEQSHRRSGQFAVFGDGEIFRQLRTDPFYGTVAERLPDVAGAVVPLIRDLSERRIALCLGDFTPKNMLLHDRGFTLVDFETATWGEPAFDVGLFLAHLVLKALHRSDRSSEFRAAIERFLLAYREATPSLGGFQTDDRLCRHLGACLLSRTDGTSPATYLDEAACDRARAIARRLLAGDPWSAVVSAI